MPRVGNVRRTEKGAATAELAASIPLLVFITVLLVQCASVMVDQLAVVQAAREGARMAAVSPSSEAVGRAVYGATSLSSDRLKFTVGERPEPGELVRVSVTYKSRVLIPLSGLVLVEPELKSRAAMAVEG